MRSVVEALFAGVAVGLFVAFGVALLDMRRTGWDIAAGVIFVLAGVVASIPMWLA